MFYGLDFTDPMTLIKGYLILMYIVVFIGIIAQNLFKRVSWKFMLWFWFVSPVVVPLYYLIQAYHGIKKKVAA